MSSRTTWLFRLLLPLSCVVMTTAWGSVRLWSSHDRALAAAAELFAARNSAGRIVAMKRQTFSTGKQGPDTELRRRIGEAAQSAGVPSAAIESISQQAPRPLKGTQFEERPTQLQLRQVTMRQWVTFLHTLTADGSALRVGSIRLVAPREQQAGDQWNAEATITALVHAPSTGRVSADARGG